MQFSRNDYIKHAEEITNTLRNHYLDEDGILTFGYVNGSYVRSQILDDFGDVAPFIATFGGEDMCINHLNYLKTKKTYKNFKHAFAYTDLILGLIWYSRIGEHSQIASDLAVEISEYFIKKWIKRGCIGSRRINKMLLPVLNGVDSTFVEVWTEMYRLTGDIKYKVRAIATAEEFRNLISVSKESLIPKNSVHVNLLGKSFDKQITLKGNVKVMKDNTNYLFGLLDLYRLTADKECLITIKEITEILKHKFESKNFTNFLTQKDVFELLPSFATIDFCADAYEVTKDRFFLEFATDLSDYWISLQRPETGLMPLFSNKNASFFDCETDMSVALSKMYEITNNETYGKSSESLLTGILNFHRNERGYVDSVDIETGEPLTDLVKTKFVALLIKPLYLRISQSTIYGNEKTFMFMKDR